MSDITKHDKNFVINTSIDKDDIKFYDVESAPFKLYGVFRENGIYRRIPEQIAKSVSSGVAGLNMNAAGGRVRFKTDSTYVAIRAKMPSVARLSHFALTGSAGFDVYAVSDEGVLVKSFKPPYDMKDGYESVVDYFGRPKMREITVNFPLYSSVSELHIGLSDKATVCAPDPYAIEKPIVFYGSSITQGGCASRPGNAYEAMISRRFNANYINLGFAGNAMAEDAMAEYIKGLEMSVFVYDYDHNAPSTDHLEKTHERMFKIVREANPTLPIIMMPRPHKSLLGDERSRFEIIKGTYENAVASGDKNVYLLDNATLLGFGGDDGLVDNCHPNDLGFACMAKAVGDLLEKIL